MPRGSIVTVRAMVGPVMRPPLMAFAFELDRLLPHREIRSDRHHLHGSTLPHPERTGESICRDRIGDRPSVHATGRPPTPQGRAMCRTPSGATTFPWSIAASASG